MTPEGHISQNGFKGSLSEKTKVKRTGQEDASVANYTQRQNFNNVNMNHDHTKKTTAYVLLHRQIYTALSLESVKTVKLGKKKKR